MITILLIFGLLLAAQNATAATAIGTIKELFVTQTGLVALKVIGGFSQKARDECPTNNGFAGNGSNADPLLKSTFLGVFTARQNVGLVISGCNATRWQEITAVYTTN